MTEDRPSLDALRIDRAAEAGARPGRRWPWLAAAAALAIAAAGAWWVLAGDRAPRVTTAPVVEVRGGAPAVLDASGYVTARRQATVSSKVTGKIVEVLVEEGMVVADGQVLARLDDSSQRAAVRLAEAGHAAARGALAETEARLAKARLDRERAERLVADAVVPREQLDAAAMEVDALAARLALERDRVEVASREVGMQRIALDDTVIRAPFAGVAISKNAQPGEMISPISAGGGFTRTGVCTLVDMDSLEIEVDVGESYIQRVHPGQRVEAVLDAYPEWRIPARVITTIPAADRERATVKVRIAFDRLDPRILPDMGVKVSFLDPRAAAAAPDEPRSRLLVPRAAVREEAGEARVWVVEEGRVEERAVELGARSADRVQVLDGLAAGERVVVESSEELTEGAEVQEASGS